MTFLGGVRWADISSDTQSLSATPCTPSHASGMVAGGLGVAPTSAATAVLLLQNEAAEHSYLNPSSCAAEFENSSAGLNLHFRNAAALGGSGVGGAGGEEAVDDLDLLSPTAGGGEDHHLSDRKVLLGKDPRGKTGGGRKGEEAGGGGGRGGRRSLTGGGEGVRDSGVCTNSGSTSSTPGFKGLLGGNSSSASSCQNGDHHYDCSSTGRRKLAHFDGSHRSSTTGSSSGAIAGGGVTGRKPRRSSNKAIIEDESEACANWREAGRMNAGSSSTSGASVNGSGHRATAPALTPAKRNRRVSGGGGAWSSSRSGGGKTLLSTRDMEEEEDEEEGLSSSSCDGRSSGGQQHPLKKKRSLPQYSSGHQKEGSSGVVFMSDGAGGGKEGEREKENKNAVIGEERGEDFDRRTSPSRENGLDGESVPGSGVLNDDHTGEKENSCCHPSHKGNPSGVYTPGGGDMMSHHQNITPRGGKRSSACSILTSSSSGGGTGDHQYPVGTSSFKGGGKRSGRRSVGSGIEGKGQRRRRTSGGATCYGSSASTTVGLGGGPGGGGMPSSLHQQQSPNLLVQHMQAISAPFLHIPGFVSPMFVPVGTTPSPAGLLFPHPNAKDMGGQLHHLPDGGNKESEEEEWARRESARMKDIAIGKATEGYRNFIRTVPRDQRKEDDPSTPNPKQRCTKAEFQREYLAWRKQLHRYDTSPSVGVGVADDVLDVEERSRCWTQQGGSRDLGPDTSERRKGEKEEGGERKESEHQSSSSSGFIAQGGEAGGVASVSQGDAAGVAKAAAVRICGRGGGPSEKGRKSTGEGEGNDDRRGDSDSEADAILAFNRDCELAGL
ncbi:histone hairpin-binding protein [Cystoisospora suis]|uniref:Histone hairpin-binding protein n=1 Tax=Cystoisospora suis TaxID=483139 RepID=A0A2C6L7C7_9APIC|nr:histone hairpin-binding protein [Cystoisospora suis]